MIIKIANFYVSMQNAQPETQIVLRHSMNQVHSTMYLWQLELRSSSGWAEPKVRWPLLRVYVHDMYRLLSSATTHQATSKLFFKSTDIL